VALSVSVVVIVLVVRRTDLGGRRPDRARRWRSPGRWGTACTTRVSRGP